MIVTFFNASGIDFGNFLNAHLKSQILPPNYLTSTAMAAEILSFYYDALQLAEGSFVVSIVDFIGFTFYIFS